MKCACCGKLATINVRVSNASAKVCSPECQDRWINSQLKSR